MTPNKSHWRRWGRNLEQWAYRGLDQHLRVGITGLSGAGKTAFLTSLVHQLLHAEPQHLPMWQALSDGRLLGVQRQSQPDLALLPFDYDNAIAGLCANPPQWPPSTRGLSEIRLALRFAPAGGLKRQLIDHLTLYLDLVDYPGEWLLDLPMLNLEFADWSRQQWQMLSAPPWNETTGAWLAEVEQLSDEAGIEPLAAQYGSLLGELRQSLAATYLQPGRALLPAELAGTPILAFFPLSPQRLEQHDDPLVAVLRSRYDAYCEQVVKPFYRKHFARFDRQVVLVDTLGALDKGHAQITQMADAIQAIQQSFHYGPGSLLRRLFRPRIDKLLFAAGKADHITVDQHANLLSLTDSLMGQSGRLARFSGSKVETMVLSAIRASQQGQVDRGGLIPVIRGVDMAQQAVTRFPGEVPSQLPEPSFWQQQGFEFGRLAPPQLGSVQAPLPHMRMDHLIEWMLGDKM
ncbi:YcjX family GTP-binding protein [Ferrimonas marina]|nr:YcjX family protein [Ferrimonas marina]